jgi:hypothetical protein
MFSDWYICIVLELLQWQKRARNGHSTNRSRTAALHKIADVAIYWGLVPFEHIADIKP